MIWQNRKVKRPAVAGSQTQDTSGLSHQCSATEPRQPDNLKLVVHLTGKVTAQAIARPIYACCECNYSKITLNFMWLPILICSKK